MKFIEVEKSIKDKEWNMTELHSHAHYEIYFLLNGTRSFFLNDKMYKITAPCLIIISPYTMHKTEGFGFSRININVSPSSLNSYEKSVFNDLNGKIIQLNDEEYNMFSKSFEECINIYESQDKYSIDKLSAILSYMILQMEKLDKNSFFEPVKGNTEEVTPLALKIIDYVSNNYTNDITLEELSNIFYISKVSICSYFKKAMNCTIGEYLMRLRLNKAKQLLSDTKKNVEEISSLCGFSSGAYFGLIFKQKIGISPLQYRKIQNTKQ